MVSPNRFFVALSWALSLSSLCATPIYCAGTSNEAKPSPEARFATLDRDLLAIESGQKAIASDRWDADDVLRQVGREPRKLFAWVNDNTLWIPYRGVLRGASGVLMDGYANSLDRSVLLATLLERAGHKVRLAHATITPEQAAAILPDLVAQQASDTVFAQGAEPGLLRKLQAAATQFAEGSGSAQAITAQNLRASQILSGLEARVGEQSQRLLGGLTRPDARTEWNAAFGKAVMALQDHWWVQRQDGDAWIDMDGLSPELDGSKALAEPSETMALKDAGKAADLHHEVVLRVIAEQSHAGVVSERVALERVLRPADLLGKSVALQFWPTAPLQEEPPPGAAAPLTDIRAAMLGQHEWAAFLMIEREAADAAVLPENGADPDVPAKGGSFGALARGFGSATAPKAPAPSRDVLSAVWLDYEIRVPGEEPRTVRRAVFDLIGPAARAAGVPKLAMNEALRLTRARALMMRTEILALPCRVAPEFVTHLITASVLGNRELLKGTASDGLTGDAAIELTNGAVPTVSALYALALAQAENSSPQTYVDRPIVLTSHSYPKAAGDGEALVEATDIVANDIGVSLAEVDAFSLRLAQGVRDTNAEAMVKGQGVWGNTGEAFAASKDWVTLTSPDESAVATLKLSADARQRVLDDLVAGYAVVVPPAAVALKTEPFMGWWRINTTSGQTLGIAESGWGQAAEHGANTGRAGAMGRVVIAALKRFASGFAGMYGWCVLPLVHKNIDQSGFKLGLQITAKESVGDCVGDALFVGALATLPLVAITLNRSGRAKALPEPPPPEPPKEDPCLADTQPVDIQPELADTQAAGADPALADTQAAGADPALADTQAAGGNGGAKSISPGDTQVSPPFDPSKANPRGNPASPRPQQQPPYRPGDTKVSAGKKTEAGLSPGNKTDPGVGPDPFDADRAALEMSKTEPGGNPDKAALEMAKTEAGGNPENPALDKTVNAEPPAPRQSPRRWNGMSNPTPEQVAELRADAAQARSERNARRSELQSAAEAAKGLGKESFNKNGEWIRYKAKGNPESPFADLENFDPAKEAELKQAADAANERSMDEAARWKRASEAFQAAEEDFLIVQRFLNRAEEIVNKARGGGCK